MLNIFSPTPSAQNASLSFQEFQKLLYDAKLI